MACARCGCGVYQTEDIITLNKIWHKCCFTCCRCKQRLDKCSAKIFQGEVFCNSCYSCMVQQLEKCGGCEEPQVTCSQSKPCGVASSPSCTVKTSCCKQRPSFDYCKKYEVCFPAEPKVKCTKPVRSCSCIPDKPGCVRKEPCCKIQPPPHCFTFPIPREVANYYNRVHMMPKRYTSPPNCCQPPSCEERPCIRIRTLSPCRARSPCQPRCPDRPICTCPRCSQPPPCDPCSPKTACCQTRRRCCLGAHRKCRPKRCSPCRQEPCSPCRRNCDSPCRPDPCSPCRPDPCSPCRPDPCSTCRPDPCSPCRPDPCSPCRPDPCSPCRADPCSPCRPDPCSPCRPDPCSPCRADPCSPCRPDPCSPCRPDPCSPCRPDPCSPCRPDPCSPCRPDPCSPCRPDPCSPCRPDPCSPCRPDPCSPCRPDPCSPCRPDPCSPCRPEPCSPCRPDPCSRCRPDPTCPSAFPCVKFTECPSKGPNYCAAPCDSMPTTDGCGTCFPSRFPKYCPCGNINPCGCKYSRIRTLCTAICVRCGYKVYAAERVLVTGGAYHTSCFSCYCCHKLLDVKSVYENCGEIYCKQCYNCFFGTSYYGYGTFATCS